MSMKPLDPSDEYLDALVASGIATPIVVQNDKVFIVHRVGTHEIFSLDDQESTMLHSEKVGGATPS